MDNAPRAMGFGIFVILYALLHAGCTDGYPQKRATNNLSNTDGIGNLLNTQNQLFSQMVVYLNTLTKGIHLTAGDCSDVAAQGPYISGVYTLTPWDDLGRQGSFKAFCDLDTAEESWTVIQKRFDGSVDFFRDWEDYKNGFGDLNGEHWLGLEKINRLTRTGSSWKLRIELKDFDNNTAYAEYDDFGVGDESTNFQLELGEYNGTAGDGLRTHANMQFSTKDRDNDVIGGNCAAGHKGAWWYKGCHHSNLNGFYSGYPEQSAATMAWRHFTGSQEALKSSEMKIRPVN